MFLSLLTQQLNSFQKYWRLFWLFRQFAVMKLTAYRADFWFWSGVSLMWTAFNFFFFGLIINLRGELAGWSRWELYAVLSVYTMLDAVIWGFFNHNMLSYTNRIYNGELSLWLVKPVNTQFLLLTSENSYNNVPRFFVGLAALAWSLFKLGHLPSLGEWIGFWLAFTAALTLIYSCWFIIATGAFWVERLQNIHEVIPALRRIWQVPRDVYSGLTATILTVVVPLGLASSVPSELVVGRGGWSWLLYLVVVATCSAAVATKFFSYSSKKFASVGG